MTKLLTEQEVCKLLRLRDDVASICDPMFRERVTIVFKLAPMEPATSDHREVWEIETERRKLRAVFLTAVCGLLQECHHGKRWHGDHEIKGATFGILKTCFIDGLVLRGVKLKSPDDYVSAFHDAMKECSENSFIEGTDSDEWHPGLDPGEGMTTRYTATILGEQLVQQNYAPEKIGFDPWGNSEATNAATKHQAEATKSDQVESALSKNTETFVKSSSDKQPEPSGIAKGVSLQNAAVLIRQDDPARQKELVTAWRNSRSPKLPCPIGKDPDHRQRNLYNVEQLLAFLGKIEEGVDTVSKRLQNAKMFFRRMTKENVIRDNPFEDVKYYYANDKKKNAIIDRPLYNRIMEAMPDSQWRAIVALARIGALRCPSEVLSLRRCDIDWAGGWMNVRSPKNEHHPGKEARQVPLFAELQEVLTEAFEMAPEGAEHVIWKPELRSGAKNSRGWQNANLRGRFNHFLRVSGIPDIPKPFQSMRSSRENEMVEEYPLKCVVDWVGHDIKVAAKHYLDSSNEEHHRKAILGQEKVTSNPTHAMTERAGNGLKTRKRQENRKAVNGRFRTGQLGAL